MNFYDTCSETSFSTWIPPTWWRANVGEYKSPVSSILGESRNVLLKRCKPATSTTFRVGLRIWGHNLAYRDRLRMERCPRKQNQRACCTSWVVSLEPRYWWSWCQPGHVWPCCSAGSFSTKTDWKIVTYFTSDWQVWPPPSSDQMQPDWLNINVCGPRKSHTKLTSSAAWHSGMAGLVVIPADGGQDSEAWLFCRVFKLQ